MASLHQGRLRCLNAQQLLALAATLCSIHSLPCLALQQTSTLDTVPLDTAQLDTSAGPHQLASSTSRHLLQFESFVRDETPQQQMERVRREMALSQLREKEAAAVAAVKASFLPSRPEIPGIYQRKGASTTSRNPPEEEGELEVVPPVLLETAPAESSAASSADLSPRAKTDEEERVEAEGKVVTIEELGPETHVLKGCDLETFGGRKVKGGGERYGAWTLCGNGVVEGMVVYSFGMGSDVSFDWALIQKGAYVYGFDPTKTHKYARLNFIKNHGLQDKPEKFIYKQAGLGVDDGSAAFFKNAAAGVGSLSAVPLDQLRGYKDVGYHAKLLSLATCRKIYGHGWIHVLKIDAEGVELDACESAHFVKQLQFVTQVLIEFHDGIISNGRRRKISCIKKIEKLGFTVVHETSGSREVSFARLK